MKHLLTATILMGGAAQAQSTELADIRCGFPTVERAATVLQRGPGDCAYSSTTTKPRYAPENGIVYEIPVVFHVISNVNGKGNIGPARIHDQMDVINEASAPSSVRRAVLARTCASTSTWPRSTPTETRPPASTACPTTPGSRTSGSTGRPWRGTRTGT